MNLWRHRTLAFSAMAVAMTAGGAQAADGRQRCDFYRAFACSAARCSDVTTRAWALIDWDAKTYAVCDPTNCQTVSFVPWPDGIYISMTFPLHDLMAKVNLTDASIVETSTSLNTSITSFGNCARDDGH